MDKEGYIAFNNKLTQLQLIKDNEQGLWLGA